MKALSIKQPFAELILQGKKTIELRTWNTQLRGEFFIHASKIPHKEAMDQFHFKKLPTGCIVGKAVLVNVKHYITKKEHQKDKHLHLGSSAWGNYGFVLEGVKRTARIPLKGKLGFFTV